MTGSGAPTAGFVYKLVEVDGRAVAKRSEDKVDPRRPQDRGAPAPVDRHGHRGGRAARRASPSARDGDRALQAADGARRRPLLDVPTLDESRAHLKRVLTTLPWQGSGALEGRARHPHHLRGAHRP